MHRQPLQERALELQRAREAEDQVYIEARMHAAGTSLLGHLPVRDINTYQNLEDILIYIN